MSALITRRLTPDEHLEIEGGFSDLHELFPRPILPEHVYWILAAHEAGMSVAVIAARCRVSPHAVRHVIVCNSPHTPGPFGRATLHREAHTHAQLFVAFLLLAFVLGTLAFVMGLLP